MRAFFSKHHTWLYWAYLAIATSGEIGAVFMPPVGLAIYSLLLLCLLAHNVLTSHADRGNLALALTPAALIRVLSLTMPLFQFPQAAWYPLVAFPLMVAVWIISRQAGYGRRELGLVPGRVPLQLALTLAGLMLGVMEYFILHPAPLAPSLDPAEVALYALVLLVFTGLNEELLFRGLMQTAAIRVLGRSALLYVSLLFGVLHMGYLSLFDLLFVTAVGLAFAHVVRRGGSILGVTLAHGLTNITLFIIAPLALADPWSNEAFTLYTLAVAGAAIAVWAALALRHPATPKAPAPSDVHTERASARGVAPSPELRALPTD